MSDGASQIPTTIPPEEHSPMFHAKFGTPIHHPRTGSEQAWTEYPLNPGWSCAEWQQQRWSGIKIRKEAIRRYGDK